jgi:GNAT superfamily N-acetyltransferase
MSPDFIEENEVWVLEDEGEVLGFHGLIHRGDLVLLEHLWLLPEHIGKGHGHRLFEHAVERARAAGGTRLEWSAEPHAIGFYERVGGQHLRDEAERPGRQGKIYWFDLRGKPSSSEDAEGS